MRVIFAGGGTGGHLYPAIAIAEELQSKGVDFYFLVSDRGIEARILTSLGYSYHEQNVSAFSGESIFGKMKAIIKLILSVFSTFKYIKKGDKVILTGGFAAAPAAVVAKLKGAELYLHEQNSVMGIVNKLFAKFCKKVFLSFSDTKNVVGNTVVTGNPIRKIFRKLPIKSNFTGDILVLGGSQGSRAINRLITSSIDKLMQEGYKVTHQTGEGLYKETLEAYNGALRKYGQSLSVRPYIEGVAQAMSEADMIIGRAGSGTIFEAFTLNLPAIYIPFKAASANHQYYNAEAVEKIGCALMIDEDIAGSEVLLAKVKEIKDKYNEYKEAFKKNPSINSLEKIMKEVGLD